MGRVKKCDDCILSSPPPPPSNTCSKFPNIYILFSPGPASNEPHTYTFENLGSDTYNLFSPPSYHIHPLLSSPHRFTECLVSGCELCSDTLADCEQCIAGTYIYKNISEVSCVPHCPEGNFENGNRCSGEFLLLSPFSNRILICFIVIGQFLASRILKLIMHCSTYFQLVAQDAPHAGTSTSV